MSLRTYSSQLGSQFIAVLAILTTHLSQARAYSYPNCSGDPIVWSDTVLYNVDSPNMSSAQHGDVDYAVDQWNAIPGMANVHAAHGHIDGAEAIPPTPDSFNTIWGTNGANIPGNNAVNWVVWDRALCIPTPQIIESDIVFAKDIGLVTGNAACDDAATALRTTLLHELGHGLGLNHFDAAMGVMMTSAGVFKYCGTTTKRVKFGPDDIAGGIFGYPGAGTNRDVAASSWEMNGNNSTSFVDINSGGGACPGGNVTFEWSIANQGNLSVADYDVQFYLSSDKTITSGDTLVATATGGAISALAWATYTTTITVPAGTARGTNWFIGWILDYNSQVAESNESNNFGFVPNDLNVCP